MKKYGYCLIFSVILLALLLFGFKKADAPAAQKQYPIEFSLAQKPHSLSIHESEEGIYYVFLPSYAKMAETKILLPTGKAVSLNGIPLENGMTCEGFQLETPYSLTVDTQYIAELYFYHSANVATMHIDTVTGTLERIHYDKNYSEQASVSLYTPDGILDTTDTAAYIKGRGNASWSYGKRPYLLTFSSEADLLGMGAATKWILLANAIDLTNLSNKLVLDTARQTGQVWSPENRYVDIYINGKYEGLYLLTEKVEVGPSRLDIDPQSGDFLGKIDIEKRWTTLKSPVKTQIGRTVEISSPSGLTNHTRDALLESINHMEEIIMSGSDLSEVACFDLDSWVHRYLLDEISANIDSDLVSSYFYRSDGVYYAGPVWDYDMTFGVDTRNISPTTFVAKIAQISESYASPYYDALYANPSFYNRMVEIYRTVYLPILQQLTEGGIYDMAAEIRSAATMNYLRWETMYNIIRGWNDRAVHSVDDLNAYLEARMAFLNSAWLEGTEYCTVQFEYTIGDPYWTFSVKKGDQLVTDYINVENSVWFDKATGNVFDLSQPITADVLLTVHDPNAQRIATDLDSLKNYVIILTVALFLVFIVCLTYADIRLRKKERSVVHAPDKTHVSP